jgi:hypothetical protein
MIESNSRNIVSSAPISSNALPWSVDVAFAFSLPVAAPDAKWVELAATPDIIRSHSESDFL